MKCGDQWQFLQFGWHFFTVEQPQPPLVSPWPPEQMKIKQIFHTNLIEQHMNNMNACEFDWIYLDPIEPFWWPSTIRFYTWNIVSNHSLLVSWWQSVRKRKNNRTLFQSKRLSTFSCYNSYYLARRAPHAQIFVHNFIETHFWALIVGHASVAQLVLILLTILTRMNRLCQLDQKFRL